MFAVESRLLELEKRIDVLERALYLLLFEEGEDVSREEVEEIRERLKDYFVGRMKEFISFEEFEENV